MILVGRHVNGARREWEPAADAGGIELGNEGDGGAVEGMREGVKITTRSGRAKSKAQARMVRLLTAFTVVAPIM